MNRAGTRSVSGKRIVPLSLTWYDAEVGFSLAIRRALTGYSE
jgi:hypothetical protein